MKKAFFISRVYELCKLKEISLQDFIQRTDFVPNTVYAWERKEAIPSIKSIEKLCEFFETDISSFFLGYDEGKLPKLQEQLLEDWRRLNEIEQLAIRQIISTFKTRLTE